jgi:hypothetical protein
MRERPAALLLFPGHRGWTRPQHKRGSNAGAASPCKWLPRVCERQPQAGWHKGESKVARIHQQFTETQARVAALQRITPLRQEPGCSPRHEPACNCLSGALEHALVVREAILQPSDYCLRLQHRFSCCWARWTYPAPHRARKARRAPPGRIEEPVFSTVVINNRKAAQPPQRRIRDPVLARWAKPLP